uniref:Uncharacterized protein n=1 Tax=Glossina palpalis gambiensis TaxID=67801 RepID=A0A1B0AXE9_9MUSC
MPFPAAINRPVGPFILSVHPGTGSRQTGITIDGLKIIAGSSSKFSATKASDNDFVYAYVLVYIVSANYDFFCVDMLFTGFPLQLNYKLTIMELG